jgi:hypothetical protein
MDDRAKMRPLKPLPSLIFMSIMPHGKPDEHP